MGSWGQSRLGLKSWSLCYRRAYVMVSMLQRIITYGFVVKGHSIHVGWVDISRQRGSPLINRHRHTVLSSKSNKYRPIVRKVV